MSLRTISGRHVRLITVHWARSAVRSGAGLVFLVVALLFGLVAAQVILEPIELTMAKEAREGRDTSREDIVASVVEFGKPVIRWALGLESAGDAAPPDEADQAAAAGAAPDVEQAGPPQTAAPADPWAAFLLDERPALLSAIFLVQIFGMPLLVPFLAFNQISGDVQSRGLRYVLLRTERANIFLGRFLGTAVFSTLVVVFIVVTVTFYLGVRIKIYPAGSLAVWGLHGLAALVVLLLPYIAVCSWISTVVDSPFLSLVVANLVIGGLLLFAVIAGTLWEPAIYLKYALPWGLQNHLLHPELSHSVGTALACLGYTAAFLFLGYRRFETRDL